MSSNLAIRIHELSKSYRIQHANGQRATNLSEALRKKLRQPFASSDFEEFSALQDINLEIGKGEVVGVIGRNGAGKSTLLKILSRITEPTSGKIELFGRVGSLLEVGTGFHPELTGRENIFLNGAILGMRRPEINRQFDAIVDFAGVEKFLDTPVKRYSSGMYVRLAFAVAAHLNPEILIVDEVLAVGDAGFQKKCLGKMQDVAKSGRTVLLVSHNMHSLLDLCDKGICLHRGQLISQGSMAQVAKLYAQKGADDVSETWAKQKDDRVSQPGFKSIRVLLKGTQPCLKLHLEFSIDATGLPGNAWVAFEVHSLDGGTLMQAIPSLKGFVSPNAGVTEQVVEVDLPPLIPGNYLVTAWLGTHFNVTIDQVREAVSFEVLEGPQSGRTFGYSQARGFLVPSSRLISPKKYEVQYD
ncbi:polysaccharide ABC transporter ATP-binding protein [Rhodopirellula maiorica SM1]|uniref:Polysaccharide ABC transporter ATP-binding protein n=1 Tax=Rhodopirellula maiorica SM1 TaxID=1265738 RepID=M5R869_9BACT|nr:ABC transporter ATP-binding protein [Rhodopirellula maiorica]EMI15585.1 polysaccharide ABC transporter ATP-binding protein [Rhodopirellula maiorica SM1]